jgi:hypothetical protein
MDEGTCIMKTPKSLEAIADVVLAYHPKPKSKAAKKRKRKEKRIKTIRCFPL